MRLLLHYADGSIRPAMLLSAMENRIRVALPGCDDVTELCWAGEQWICESGEAVEVDFDPAAAEFGRRAERAASIGSPEFECEDYRDISAITIPALYPVN